jgi:hypothetical protein
MPGRFRDVAAFEYQGDGVWPLHDGADGVFCPIAPVAQAGLLELMGVGQAQAQGLFQGNILDDFHAVLRFVGVKAIFAGQEDG